MLVGTAAAYAVLFIAVFLVGGSGPDTTTAGAKIIADYHKSNAAVQISGYALVIAAAVLIFFGAALRRALRRGHAHWLADAAFGGTIAITMAIADAAFGGTIAITMAIVGFVVTAYTMHDAVKTGDATVAQSINILDHANFVPAMLGLCCTFLATGLSSLRTGALPRWICLVSVILGVASPLGAAAFAPFALFPLWVIVVAAILARRMRAINSQNPANN
jgi:hypothetical protein